MASGTSFVEAVLEAFAEVQAEYGLELVRQDDDFALPRVTYTGNGVFLDVSLERRDYFFWVNLGPLVDGQVPSWPIFTTRDTPWAYFSLEQILVVRGVRSSWLWRWPFTMWSPFRADPDDTEALRKRLPRVVNLLRQHAGDLLAGDLAAFDELERVLKARFLRD